MLVYGRYVEVVVPPLIAVALVRLAGRPEQARLPRLRTVVAVMTIATVGAVALRLAVHPLGRAEPLEHRQSPLPHLDPRAGLVHRRGHGRDRRRRGAGPPGPARRRRLLRRSCWSLLPADDGRGRAQSGAERPAGRLSQGLDEPGCGCWCTRAGSATTLTTTTSTVAMPTSGSCRTRGSSSSRVRGRYRPSARSSARRALPPTILRFTRGLSGRTLDAIRRCSRSRCRAERSGLPRRRPLEREGRPRRSPRPACVEPRSRCQRCRQRLTGERLPEHGERPVRGVDADAPQAVAVRARAVSALLGRERRAEARSAGGCPHREVVVAVGVGEEAPTPSRASRAGHAASRRARRRARP